MQEYQAPPVDPRKARLRLRGLGVILDTLQVDEDHLYFKVRRQQKEALNTGSWQAAESFMK